TNANGLISLEIGDGVDRFGSFQTIDWGMDSYFLKTETDPEGGTNYSLTGITQLLTVPYAMHAKTAGNVDITGSEPAFNNWDKNGSDDFSGNYNDLSGKPTIPDPVDGNESAFNGWDKNASDDFSGNYNDLSGKPTIPDPVDGNESAFDGWDKDASDDFSGNYNDLTNVPSTFDVADNTITSAKIKDGEVKSADIASNAVGSDEIAPGAVGSSELATGSVHTPEIANGTILNEDISISAGISPSKVAGMPGAEYYSRDTYSNLPTTNTNVGSLSITCPTSGYVILMARANPIIFGDGTRVIFGMGTGSTSHNLDKIDIGHIDGSGSERRYYSACLMAVTYVTAGTSTFYISAYKTSFSTPVGVNLSEIKMQAVFVPFRY
ncbi:MAG: hypothetical protein ACOCZL_06545, partial [Bacteroidota bacterium]